MTEALDLKLSISNRKEEELNDLVEEVEEENNEEHIAVEKSSEIRSKVNVGKRRHFEKVRVKKSFQCNSCPKKLSRKDHFEAHKLKHRKDLAVLCITCKKLFKTELALFKHLIKGEYCPLQCILCTKTFVKKCNLEKHEKVCHGDEVDAGGTCEICLKTFQYCIDLERHRKSFTDLDGSFKFMCGYCERINCSFDILRNHIRSDRDSEEKKMCLEKMRQREAMGTMVFIPHRLFPCEKCGEQFASKDIMLSHLETHIDLAKPASDNQEYQCDLCQKKFTQLKNYQRHRLLAYDGKNPRNVCDLCDNYFCTSRHLKRHHTESHKVSCTTCDESFSTKRALTYHIKKMDSVRCDKCNKLFCNKKAFNLHKIYVHAKYGNI